MAEQETIAQVLRMFVKAYYGRFEADADTAEVWAGLLHDIPDAALRAAAVHLASTSKFPPSVAEVRACAFDLTSAAHQRLTAGEAWGEVVKSIRRHGTYGVRDARAELPALIWRCVEAVGGWRELCMSENGVADRARFMQSYDAYVQRERDTQRMLPEVRAFSETVAALPASDGPRPESRLPSGFSNLGDICRTLVADGGNGSANGDAPERTVGVTPCKR